MYPCSPESASPRMSIFIFKSKSVRFSVFMVILYTLAPCRLGQGEVGSGQVGVTWLSSTAGWKKIPEPTMEAWTQRGQRVRGAHVQACPILTVWWNPTVGTMGQNVCTSWDLWLWYVNMKRPLNHPLVHSQAFNAILSLLFKCHQTTYSKNETYYCALILSSGVIVCVSLSWTSNLRNGVKENIFFCKQIITPNIRIDRRLVCCTNITLCHVKRVWRLT